MSCVCVCKPKLKTNQLQVRDGHSPRSSQRATQKCDCTRTFHKQNTAVTSNPKLPLLYILHGLLSLLPAFLEQETYFFALSVVGPKTTDSRARAKQKAKNSSTSERHHRVHYAMTLITIHSHCVWFKLSPKCSDMLQSSYTFFSFSRETVSCTCKCQIYKINIHCSRSGPMHPSRLMW